MPDHLLTSITRAWSEIAAPLNDGAVVILEDAAMRIRRLPIAGETEKGRAGTPADEGT